MRFVPKVAIVSDDFEVMGLFDLGTATEKACAV